MGGMNQRNGSGIPSRQQLRPFIPRPDDVKYKVDELSLISVIFLSHFVHLFIFSSLSSRFIVLSHLVFLPLRLTYALRVCYAWHQRVGERTHAKAACQPYP